MAAAAATQHGTIGNGQLLTTLLGKMLRIDVGELEQRADLRRFRRAIPIAANARCNVNGTGAANCPEIYAYGFRNPWRWSFDRGSGELWLNDVGQSALEEVDQVTLGGNYGWRCFEGTQRLQLDLRPECRIAIAPDRAVRPHAGLLDHRRLRVPRQRHSEPAWAATCSAISAAAISGTSRATPRPR